LVQQVEDPALGLGSIPAVASSSSSSSGLVASARASSTPALSPDSSA
jgi:hypothetical protein